MSAEIGSILERLTETIAWCTPRVDLNNPKDCFRTLALRPHPLEHGRSAVVESVVRARYIALHHPQKRRATNLAGGRLLIYQADINLACGLEESETNGYVDINNIPPWDTWIDYIDEPSCNYLLSWVPKEFVALVSSGIAVSPEMSFKWIDDTEFELRGVINRSLSTS